MFAAQDDAGRRLARDIHDGAQQQFASALITLQRAQGKWSSDPARAAELLGDGVDQVRSGLGALRELIVGIHPPILTHFGLVAAVESLTASMPLPARLEIAPQRLPADLEASIYFLVAEGLTNTIKHADATLATVTITIDGDAVLVETTDDGVGGADPSGSGLTGLSDRAAALGGELTVTSPPGAGTAMNASIPLRTPYEPA
jgi:signal transduction histidine kinase